LLTLSATHAAHATHATSSKHLAKHVIHATSAPAAHAATSKHVGHALLLVVLIAIFRCSNGVVRLLNFFEFGFCSGIIWVPIRVVLAGLFPEGTLDFCVTSIPANAQQTVGVFLCHSTFLRRLSHINPRLASV
jgi:hypothetical protein